MINVDKRGILLEKTLLDFESRGVLNPAILKEGNIIHLFYRAVDNQRRSSIGYCKLDGPDNIIRRNEDPILFPELIYENYGVEDPRICKIDGVYYLTYTAFDGVNALGALAISSDLKHFEKQGVIVPQLSYFDFEKLTAAAENLADRYWSHFNPNPFFKEIDRNNLIWDKNVVFFPRRINEKLYFLHRIKPDIQIVSVTDLTELTTEFWEDHISNLEKHTALFPKYPHEDKYIGAGATPIETDHGWLLIYHGVRLSEQGYHYVACAALLDLENPEKELARLPYPLFKPDQIWEEQGTINNVCFPCGTAIFDDDLYIYYGAADERIAYARLSLSELLKELKQY